jgi:hypothetical protein
MATFCALIAVAGYAIFLGGWFACPVIDYYLGTDVYSFVSLASGNKKSDYGALFLQVVGSYTIVPCLHTWNTNNAQPHYRRATAVAVGVASLNIGGIVSAWIFDDAPRFHKATCINLAFSLAMAVASVCLIFYFRVRNAAKRREVRRLLQMDGKGTGNGEWDSPEERMRLGDRHPRFEFTM